MLFDLSQFDPDLIYHGPKYSAAGKEPVFLLGNIRIPN